MDCNLVDGAEVNSNALLDIRATCKRGMTTASNGKLTMIGAETIGRGENPDGFRNVRAYGRYDDTVRCDLFLLLGEVGTYGCNISGARWIEDLSLEHNGQSPTL